jgi:hypothetical protein
MRRTTPLALLALVPLLLAGCSDDYSGGGGRDYGGDPVTTTTRGDEPAAVLTAEDTETQLEVGETVLVELIENQSVGDLWLLAEEPDDSVLEVVSDEAVGPEDDCDGCAGTRQIELEAVGEGETSFVVANCFRCDAERDSIETPPEPAEVEFTIEVVG